MLRLTPNKTVFEYDDALDNNSLLVYHPGYIRINEIDLYRQYENENVEINTRIIHELCIQLYDTIHNRNFHWMRTGDINEPEPSNIMSTIIGRLKCIHEDYNEYNYLEDYLRVTCDEEGYQELLSNYIINKFISTIGMNQTLILFAKYFGNILDYLFNQ